MANLKNSIEKGIFGVETMKDQIWVTFNKGYTDDDMIIIEVNNNNAVSKVAYAHPFCKDPKQEHDVPIEREDIVMLVDELTKHGVELAY